MAQLEDFKSGAAVRRLSLDGVAKGVQVEWYGDDRLLQDSSDAVLIANYVLARLKDTLSQPFEGPSMHEVLFDDRSLPIAG